MPTKKKKSTTNTLNNEFKKKKKQEARRRWGIKALGIGVMILFVVGLYYGTRFFSFASDPMREFPQFPQVERIELRKTEQVYVGIWYEVAPGQPRRNAVAVFSPQKVAITLFTLPEELSARDPRSLQSEITLPIDRYVILPYALTQGESLEEFVQQVAADWYANYTGLSSYTKLPEVIERISAAIHTDASPRELSWLARFLAKVSPEDISVRTWPTDSFETEQVRLGYLVDPTITKGANRVWIRNNTDVPGLATAVASLMANIGFEIVRVDTYECADTEDEYCDSERTRILVGQTLVNSYEVIRAGDVFGAVVEESTGDDLKRADIVVLVGENVRYLVGE